MASPCRKKKACCKKSIDPFTHCKPPASHWNLDKAALALGYCS